MPKSSAQRWSLTPAALERLLERLGNDPESAAREYEILRRRLTNFFSMQRVDCPESLVDDTIDRVARRMEEGERVEHVRAYFYGVARRVAFEWVKRQVSQRQAVRTHRPLLDPAPTSEPAEARAACLERCLNRLPPEERTLLYRYYHPEGSSLEEHRRRLAEELGITSINLRVRAHRIRVSLHARLRECLETERARIAFCSRKIRRRPRASATIHSAPGQRHPTRSGSAAPPERRIEG